MARRRNISRAAEALTLSQTAVSWRIRTLESTIGARLFERNGKGVRLTRTGERFYEHAVRITDATRRALDETRREAPPEDRVTARPPARRGRKPAPASE